jgi:hypothetical protein
MKKGDSSGGAGCTGTFVSPNTLITAAHCSYGCEGKAKDCPNQVFRTKHNKDSIKSFISPKFGSGYGPDLRVVIFPDGTSKDFYRLGPSKVGDSVTLVGIGLKSSKGKRVGTITSKESNVLKGTGGIISSGDSGGPVLLSGNILTGVIYMANSGSEFMVTNLFSDDSMELLKRSVQEGAVICGFNGSECGSGQGSTQQPVKSTADPSQDPSPQVATQDPASVCTPYQKQVVEGAKSSGETREKLNPSLHPCWDSLLVN